MLDVLPRALVAAAAAVRDFGRSCDPLPRTQIGEHRLDAALETYVVAWDAAASDLAHGAAVYADLLIAAAAEYVAVDALLVPRALR